MVFHRLSWRVGLPIVLLVLVEAVALAAYTSHQIAGEDTHAFECAATQNAAHIARRGWPASEELAGDLQEVVSHGVFFRNERGGLVPPPPAPLHDVPFASVPADGRAVRHGPFELVAVRLPARLDRPGRSDLLFVRETRNTLLDPRTLTVLGAGLLLAALIAWVVVRGLVLPLRRLASHLPRIETPGPLDLPDAARHDEIGDLARAFVRTRDALQAERDSRERAERLAVLGRMTGALAHEVQNPVAAIRMHAQLWHGEHADETAAIIEQEAQRIESLLNQWMYLTRPEAPAVRELDVALLIAQVVASHRAQAEHAAVRVETRADGDLRASADGKRLQQVFSNLVVNAIQAMPAGGTLSITAWSDASHVHVRFADTGRGFSPTALQRFAEFFYSEREGGMGIGLSVASEIMKAHGGGLRVQNRAEGGAEVTVSLQRARG
jgi:signal transduction histidine kinase